MAGTYRTGSTVARLERSLRPSGGQNGSWFEGPGGPVSVGDGCVVWSAQRPEAQAGTPPPCGGTGAPVRVGRDDGDACRGSRPWGSTWCRGYGRERWLPFGLVLSPPVGIGLAAGLTILRRSRFADLPRQPAVLAAWTGMVVLGIASGLSSPSPRTAAVGLAGVAVLWWLWGVGRFCVDDGPGFTVGVQRATAVVGALALAVALARAELRVSLGPVGLSLAIMSPENKGTVLGLAGNGLGPLLAFGAMVPLGRAATCCRWPDRLEGLAVEVLNLSAALALGVRNALWGGAVGAAALVPVAGVTVVAVVVGAGAAILGLRRDVLARFLELLDWRTEQARRGVWQASWRMLRDHPWLGVGPAQFHMVHPQYALPQSAHLTDSTACT